MSGDDQTEDDFALMKKVAVGDHSAFRQLVERHQNAVVGTVTKMLGNSHDAEDISQQVFLRVWKNADRYQPDAKFTTWLFTIVRHLVFNETRRRGRKKEISSEEREAAGHSLVEASPRNQPDHKLLRTELIEAVDRAIEQLPENQRMAVVLRRYEQVSYEEIAEILQVSVPSVKSLLFRARGSLRKSLDQYLEGSTDTAASS
ncbi:MAG: RNA polymerase sigma factor [Luteolibacter sp.]